MSLDGGHPCQTQSIVLSRSCRLAIIGRADLRCLVAFRPRGEFELPSHDVQNRVGSRGRTVIGPWPLGQFRSAKICLRIWAGGKSTDQHFIGNTRTPGPKLAAAL